MEYELPKKKTKKKADPLQDLLDRMIDFANLDALTCDLSLEAFRFIRYGMDSNINFSLPRKTYEIGQEDYLTIPYEELRNEMPLKLQRSMVDKLEKLLTGEKIEINYSGSCQPSSSKGALKLNLKIDDLDAKNENLANMMIQLMFFLKTKAVKRCDLCNNFYLIKTSSRKKFCTSQCGITSRQNTYRGKLTEKEKFDLRMKRAKRYQDKKDNLDNPPITEKKST